MWALQLISFFTFHLKHFLWRIHTLLGAWRAASAVYLICIVSGVNTDILLSFPAALDWMKVNHEMFGHCI